jgi:rod shape-determining protein MreC
MLKKQHYIILGVMIALTLVLLELPSHTTAKLKLAISGLFLPLFGVKESVRHGIEKAADAAIPRKQLAAQLEQFRQENQELRVRLLREEELDRENARLREALGWARETAWKLKLARVVGRDPANWWRTVRIDRGAREGIATNSAVFTPHGLVGRVSEVGYTYAQVALLGDPDCRVSVKVLEGKTVLDMGVISPSSSSPLDKSMVDLSYLSHSAPLRAGQRVITSGQGGVFPGGILVGHIVDWRSVGYGLASEARVNLAVNLNTLEEVLVKLP